MLNHAAAVRTRNLSRHFGRLVGALALSSLLLVAGQATALDGIDLSSPAEATAAGECPQLIKIKYPGLACATGQIGQSDANETWDNTRHLQRQSGWTEGDGYFGPELNPVSN